MRAEEDGPVVGRRRKNSGIAPPGDEPGALAQEGLPSGWARMTTQLPKRLADVFRAKGAERGLGGIRELATAAVAATLGMPEHARRELLRYCVTTGFDDPDHITPDGAWAVVMRAMREIAEEPVTGRSVTLAGAPVQRPGYIEEVIERVPLHPPKQPDDSGGKRAKTG